MNLLDVGFAGLARAIAVRCEPGDRIVVLGSTGSGRSVLADALRQRGLGVTVSDAAVAAAHSSDVLVCLTLGRWHEAVAATADTGVGPQLIADLGYCEAVVRYRAAMRYRYERIAWSHDLRDQDVILHEVHTDGKRLVAIACPPDGKPYAIIEIPAPLEDNM